MTDRNADRADARSSSRRAPSAVPAGEPAPTDGGAAELAEFSYEQARAELAAVVERLEAGGCPLEEALALWERGEALAEVCQRRLDSARARLDRARTPPAA